MKRIEKCPHCGSTDGVITYYDLINIPCRMGFNGEEQENYEMYDNAMKSKAKANVYCQNCGKVICRLSTLQKANDILPY